MKHSMTKSLLAGLRTVDLTSMTDSEVNAMYDAGAEYGFEHLIRSPGNYGVEHFFRSDVFHLFTNAVE
jgi:hypothetical protein